MPAIPLDASAAAQAQLQQPVGRRRADLFAVLLLFLASLRCGDLLPDPVEAGSDPGLWGLQARQRAD